MTDEGTAEFYKIQPDDAVVAVPTDQVVTKPSGG
jgi:hypothetical protein